MSRAGSSGLFHSVVSAFAISTLIAGSSGCEAKKKAAATTPPLTTTSLVNGGQEWVNFSTQVPITSGAFDSLASTMFGTAAQSGQFMTNNQVAQAFYVTSAADPNTPTQVLLSFALDDGTATHRTLAVTPASFAVGQVFIAAADAAMAQLAADVASNNAQGEIFDIEYQTSSSQGGTLSFGIKGNQGALSLSLNVTTPHTSLESGHVGQAAMSTGPTDNVAGTVWFNMDKDEFDYFVNHAYGSGATANQNFTNFALVPYNWLRLSVTPDLTQNIVNVAFVLLEADGTSIPVAKAPASVMAGSTFQAVVDRQMSNMLAQEATQAGSSAPWTVPFYYDQPQGGGVVQVIASGSKGIFSVAYSVASPANSLVEVPFVPYEAVTITPPPASSTETCNQQGGTLLTQGQTGEFNITFTASSVIVSNLASGQTLIGDIGCSIFETQDVTVTGPNQGAVSLEDFTVPMANLLATPSPTFTTTTPFYEGSYQILCAQYVVQSDAGGVPAGDPVTLPIGGFPIACNTNPVTVEFALLNPSNQP